LGLFAIPLLVWWGRALPEAVAILIGAGGLQTTFGTYLVRKHVRWARLIPIAGCMAIALPIGQLLMGMIVGEGQAFVKQAVGGVLLCVLIARALVQPVPREEVAAGWGLLAGGLSGLLAGLVGMGGPPVVLYALAHRWDKDRYRAFLWPLFMLTNPLLIAAMALQFGAHLWLDYAWGMALVPCVWLGNRMGLALSAQWEMKQLQRGASVLLYAMALSSLIGPML
jgi:uncharacterized membrane protein YfcA